MCGRKGRSAAGGRRVGHEASWICAERREGHEIGGVARICLAKLVVVACCGLRFTTGLSTLSESLYTLIPPDEARLTWPASMIGKISIVPGVEAEAHASDRSRS